MRMKAAGFSATLAPTYLSTYQNASVTSQTYVTLKQEIVLTKGILEV
jgi:hypothetical protein